MDLAFYREEEFQDTRRGKFPKDWEILRFDKLLSLEYGKGLPEQKRMQGMYPVVGSNGVIGYHSRALVRGPGIVIGRKGTIGAVTWIDSDFWPIDTTYYVKVASSEVDLKWLFYEVVHLDLPKLSLADVVPGLKRELVSNLVISLPPPKEQRGIVGVLGVVDLAVAKAGEVIAKTERLKRGLMQTLLTRGIGHKEYKQTPIGTTPKTWQVKRLEEASIEVTIGVVNPATPYYTSAKDGIPYFRSQNVRENRLESTNVYVKREFNERHPRSVLRENDILTLQTGFIGVSCLVTKEYEDSNCHSLLITRTNPKMLNPQFLCQFLNSDVGKKIIHKHNSGWGRAHLLLEDFRKIDVPIPPLQEQQTIAEILSTVDKKIESEKKEMTRLGRIKQGLIDLLLTGKIRVKVD